MGVVTGVNRQPEDSKQHLVLGSKPSHSQLIVSGPLRLHPVGASVQSDPIPGGIKQPVGRVSGVQVVVEDALRGCRADLSVLGSAAGLVGRVGTEQIVHCISTRCVFRGQMSADQLAEKTEHAYGRRSELTRPKLAAQRLRELWPPGLAPGRAPSGRVR
jgi:hypothetical protein